MKDRQIHTINGVDRAEGLKATQFANEVAFLGYFKMFANDFHELKEYLMGRPIQVQLPLNVAAPEPVAAEAPASKQPPVQESEPPAEPARPLESLGWLPNSAEYLAFTKRLPFPVNSVQEVLSRVRAIDLRNAEWVGESATQHIIDRLKAWNVGELLPDNWYPPEGPPESMIDPALVYAVKRDTVIPQPDKIKKPYAGRTMTVEEIADERKHLTVAQVQALLAQAEPHWNKHPHYLYHWAVQRGYVLPKHQLVNRKKKA